VATVRRLSVFVLVLTLSLIGIPLPAHAAAEEAPPITLNGRPLSQLLNRAVTGDPFPLALLLGQDTGQISGVAMDREGQPLAERTVHATRVFTIANTGERATQNAGTTTTDAAGQFSFTGLRASDYLVEVLSGDEVVASESLTLSEGAMQLRGISVSQSPSDEGGMSTAAKTAIGAGVVAGIALALIGTGVICITCANER